MLCATPPLAPHRDGLDELVHLRARLGREVSRGTPWSGRLRRQAKVATARSSVAIEGHHVSAEVASSVVDGRSAPVDSDQRAVAGYALAMQHVGVLADDPVFGWSERLLLDLHFEACSSEPSARPGRWRTGPMIVTAPAGGVAYRAPAAEEVPGLMAELVTWLRSAPDDVPVVVRAAMAHLHLVSIHPFNDGSGRLSRILQSLVLARDQVLSPELGSIEEFLADDTGRYYDALQAVQAGRYSPERSAASWVAFCLDAHRVQAKQRLATLEEAGRRWTTLEQLVTSHGWPDRLVTALELSLFGGVDRSRYCAEVDVSVASASTDLRRLVDAGLLQPQGRGRNTHYVASASLKAHIAPA